MEEKGLRVDREKIRIMQNALAEAAWPLVEYIRKCQTPMITAIVTGADVTLVATETHVAIDGEWD